ncbi:MAG: L-lactate dehydrogenase [Ignavibacteriales bacterium]|nr:L-lactate dehydrogenase [Ignavibacteriales bacterium]
MKIGIVGSGYVGATAAFAMVMRGVGREIVLVDAKPARALAEADDILHAVPFAHQLEVRPGEYQDLKDCRVVVIAAGTNQKPGETRLQLLGRNAAVFRDVVPNILKYSPDAVLVVATNPVDVMTHVTARIAAERGIASARVIGSGTTLDTARFRALLGRHVGVDPNHVHAYVLGEHGDSEVLTWSLVTVGGLSLEDFCRQQSIPLNAAVKQEIDQKVRKAAYTIISGKGATYYGIGSALARITEVIMRDQRSVLTVCTPLKEAFAVSNVTISMPHLVGGEGILSTFPPTVDNEERELLHKSASLIRDVLSKLEAAAA